MKRDVLTRPAVGELALDHEQSPASAGGDRLGAQLVAELDVLGVCFLQDGHATEATGKIAPARLLALLASSDEARLRLAIIPLLLHRPDFATHIDGAVQVNASAQVVLKCYYTAARYLQQKYRLRLEAVTGHNAPLPDLFSLELGLQPAADPDSGLSALAKRHAVLSGKSINWLGTYEHAARRWLTYMERLKS